MMISLGQRRVQKTGRGVHLNLPKVWVKNAKIVKHDQINCWIDSEGRLVLEVVREEGRR